MILNKTNNRVFTVCSLVLLWSLFSAAGAWADSNQFRDFDHDQDSTIAAGTVYDEASGLTWEKEGSQYRKTWEQSLTYVEGLNASAFGSCREWRLPTAKELDRLVDHSKNLGLPHIDGSYFPNSYADFYWTSSSKQGTLKFAISFGDGRQRTMSSSNKYYVRAVHGECQPNEDDKDGDGYTSDVDCNDNDPNIHPGATDSCDLVDTNCDGVIDDSSCLTVDGDHDNVAFQYDCDDHDPENFPGNAESCDGRDNDCDGVVDNALSFDEDEDGYTAVGSCDGIKDATGEIIYDCNDNDVAINPEAVEICDDVDNNCDGNKDENLTQTTTCGVGECAGNTGIETCENGVWGHDTCDPFAGATGEICDDKDNNCNGQIDDGLVFTDYYQDNDHDQYGNAAVHQNTCNGAPAGYVTDNTDCNDNDVTINPGASDANCDGVDQNCSGAADENYVSTPTSCGSGACAATGSTSCAGGEEQNSCMPGQPSAEVCDTVDNDCNGLVDDGISTTYYMDSDGDGYGNPNIHETACTTPGGFVVDSTDCDDTDPNSHPGLDEMCGTSGTGDGADNDCDGAVDEGCATALVESEGGGSDNSIQGVYNIVADGGTDIIRMQGVQFDVSLEGGLMLDRDVTVTLIGGYDDTFTSSSGWTVISNPDGLALVISNGKVMVHNVILR